MLGGVIAGALGWRWIFLVNVPVGLAALALTPRVLRESRRDDAPGGLDLPGAAAATAGLGLLVLALAQAEQAGPLAAADARGAGRRGAPARRVRRARAHRRAAARAAGGCCAPGRSRPRSLAGALLTATTSGGAVLASLHLQDVLGLGPAAAGLVLLPFSVCAAAGSVAAPRIAGTAGGASWPAASALVAAGSAVAAAGLTRDGRQRPRSPPGACCAGSASALASVAATTLGASAVGEAERGTAAGLLNTAAQVGTAVGIAALVLVAGHARAPRPAIASASPSAAALAALGAVGLGVLLRAPARSAVVGGAARRSPT